MSAGVAQGRSLESGIARLLTVGTGVSMALVAVGTVMLLLRGIAPDSPAPAFAPDRILTDLVELRPDGFLWLGVIGVLLTPGARVLAAGVGYWRAGERAMVLVSVLIIAVIAIGIVAGSAAA